MRSMQSVYRTPLSEKPKLTASLPEKMTSKGEVLWSACQRYPAGIGLVAACKSSAPYVERITPEGLELRKQAVAEAGTRRRHQWITAIINLAQIKFDKRAFYYYYARCKECSTEFVGQDKRPHKCLDDNNTNKECLTIVRHLLYPHDVFEYASENEKADVMEWLNDYRTAVDKIPEANTPEGANPRELARQAIEKNGAPEYRLVLPLLQDLGQGQGQVAQFISRTLGSLDDAEQDRIRSQIVFTPASFGQDPSQDNEEKRWLMTMALDILISIASRCTIAQVPEDDNWSIFLRSRRSADRAFDYFANGRREWVQVGGKGRQDRSPKILVPPFMGICALDPPCDSMKIFFPKDGNSLKKADRKHSCGSYEKPSKIVKGTWMYDFMELPLAVIRALWYANWTFYDADDEHCAFLNWSFTAEETSAVERWYSTDTNKNPDDYAVAPSVN
ncbi:hypothetical protein EC957_010709 [Mortierella hygrophila]|uniref:Uncharacterized protein n=1 Tax=Mortierella hygrophila TaxID=979708 RepID=A0A9P6JXI3_9FUNG|nr:hypothetical protein EC957_010709 [Mortierella hygrophila]